MSRTSKYGHSMNSHRTREVRAAILERQGGHCRDCEATEYLSLHHVIPVRLGGLKNGMSNLVLLCEACHGRAHGCEGWKARG